MEPISNNEYRVKETQVDISALDGFVLGGTLYEGVGSSKGQLLILSGTGILQRFYRKFALFAAGQGFTVLTFDFRGVGRSRPKSLKGFNAKLRDWGQLDIAGAIEYLHQYRPELPLYALGHSMGGQQLGLAPNHQLVSGAMLVASSTAYWRGFKRPYAYFAAVSWFVLLPIATTLFGYAPAKRFGQGEDLPKGVALEFSRWCKTSSYMSAFFDTGNGLNSGQSTIKSFHADVSFPIRALGFTDDEIATKSTVPQLLSLYRNAPREVQWFSPESVGEKTIGHLGFFKKIGESHFWKDALDWFDSHSITPPGSLEITSE
jgi:predicted alpha/beta hydrolase